MKYSVKLELDGQQFEVKLGMKALLDLEDKGIKLENIQGVKIKDILTILYVGINRSNPTISFIDFVDLIDDSDKSIEDLSAVLEEALDKGIGKGKMKINNDSPNNNFPIKEGVEDLQKNLDKVTTIINKDDNAKNV